MDPSKHVGTISSDTPKSNIHVYNIQYDPPTRPDAQPEIAQPAPHSHDHDHVHNHDHGLEALEKMDGEVSLPPKEGNLLCRRM